MKLKIQTRGVYGRPIHYPMCETSKKIAMLNRRRKGSPNTFTDHDLTILRALGYEIEQVPQFGGTDAT